jgi:hypothetical protein
VTGGGTAGGPSSGSLGVSSRRRTGCLSSTTFRNTERTIDSPGTPVPMPTSPYVPYLFSVGLPVPTIRTKRLERRPLFDRRFRHGETSFVVAPSQA